MITVDTSGLIAAIGRQDPHHREALRALETDSGPRIIPVAALAEMAYLLESAFPPAVEQAFLDDLQTGRYKSGCGGPDFQRIECLTRKYSDLPLGLTDAAVISCAEQHGGRVLTFDRRHFDVVARGEGTLDVVPAL